MPSDESKGSQLDAIGSLAQRQLDNTNPGVGVAGADRRIGVVDDPVSLGQEGRCPGPDLAGLPAFEALKVQTAGPLGVRVF